MPETNEKELILQNLNYMGLDFKNIPEFLLNFDSLDYKPELVSEQINFKVYKYINIKDIQILLTPTSKSNSLVEQYSKAVPLCEYLKLSDVFDSELFSEMLKNLNKKEIEKIEKEQILAQNNIPFKVEYDTQDLWQIHYSELTSV